MRILNFFDLCELDRKGESKNADFLYCKAHISYSNGIYKFYSYNELMFKLDLDRNCILKCSDVETKTTLQHLRKFFDMYDSRQAYYNFRKIKKGDILHV